MMDTFLSKSALPQTVQLQLAGADAVLHLLHEQVPGTPGQLANNLSRLPSWPTALKVLALLVRSADA